MESGECPKEYIDIEIQLETNQWVEIDRYGVQDRDDGLITMVHQLALALKYQG